MRDRSSRRSSPERKLEREHALNRLEEPRRYDSDIMLLHDLLASPPAEPRVHPGTLKKLHDATPHPPHIQIRHDAPGVVLDELLRTTGVLETNGRYPLSRRFQHDQRQRFLSRHERMHVE